jgi:16S rRNA (guanine966-N2)-methyltransferase
MIRVIAGLYKGKKLKRVPSRDVRPMPDKLKESLMSILQEDIKNSDFLDGFAGTGSVGIEALSRGANFVLFIDDLNLSVKTIRSNIEVCGVKDKTRIMFKEFNRAVIQLALERKTFDLIFLDPPYKLLEMRNPLKVIKKRGILDPNGAIILRHHFKTDFIPKYYKSIRQIRIGDDILSIFKDVEQ